jgi:hypothetical protein
LSPKPSVSGARQVRALQWIKEHLREVDAMPLAKIYVHKGRYDEARLIKLGDAIQTALEETLACSISCRPLKL